MNRLFPTRARAVALRVLLAGIPALAACGDRPTGSDLHQIDDLPLPKGTLAALRCTAQVASSTVACEALTPAGASAQKNGPRFDLHLLGGQGTYVRLTSSNVAYNSGTQIFSFDVTVQNLATLAFATTDGATRHDNGVQVFFAAPPVPTSGSGTITLANATGQGSFTAAGQDYFQYGGKIGGIDQGELGADGILSTGETSSAKNWQMNVPNSATTFSFTLYVATQTPSGSIVSAAPQVTGVSPATLVPGASATLTGSNFSATPGNNTVTIGGVAAAVTGASTTSLNVTVPCTATGTVPVQVTQGGMKGAAFQHPLQGNVRTLAVGQAVIVTDPSQVGCNELASANGAARYTVAVYNAATSPSSSSAVQVSGDATAAAVRAPLAVNPSLVEHGFDPFVTPAERLAEQKHYELLENNRRWGAELATRFRNDPRMRRGARIAAVTTPPPANRVIHVADINSANACNTSYAVNARQVYYNGRIAIYEDADSTPSGLQAANNPAMQDYYNKIGDQFNADMYDIIKNNFGDPLLRDASTDNNGVVVALFTPIINNHFSGVAGFVIGCDQYPNAAGNLSSNFGEYFYAYQPTDLGTGYGAFTADQWYRTIRSTFIHETKHVASQAARVNNGAAFEVSWLEEGTARHVEELWARTSIYNVAWKGNTGYGSAASPNSIYCDLRPTTAACTASNSRRPSVNMFRHFSSLYTQMDTTNGAILSPFGRTPYDNASYFYAISWSLVRYAIDRYGASDAAFLTALTQASTTGTANLSARAGVSIDQLLGGWALALATDDYPGMASPSADIQMPTWDFRSIYSGLNTDFPASYRSYPRRSGSLTFGSFAPIEVAEIYGGGALSYDITGTQTAPQLVRLRGGSGGTLPSTIRVAIARVQ